MRAVQTKKMQQGSHKTLGVTSQGQAGDGEKRLKLVGGRGANARGRPSRGQQVVQQGGLGQMHKGLMDARLAPPGLQSPQRSRDRQCHAGPFLIC